MNKSSKKKILIKCYGVVALNNTFESLWEDIFLSFKIKRKPVKKFITIISKTDVENNIKDYKTLIEKYPNDDNDFYKEQLEKDKNILGFLDNGHCFFDYGNEEIYSFKPLLNKKEIENCLASYLMFYKNLKFVWKRPGIIIQSV